MTGDLFAAAGMAPDPAREQMAEGAVLMRGRALSDAPGILADIADISARAPFRRMETPGGFVMSVAITSCGDAGWVSDRRGYRYAMEDPLSGAPWPAMPSAFLALAQDSAREAGYPEFAPDSCLINRYEPGARMSLHQDRNERDFDRPIVSVSLGLPCVFQFGGPQRTDPVMKYELRHGDVVVWGGPSRLFHHGVLRLKAGEHPATGAVRYNLTFRAAL